VNCIILGRAEAYASKNPPLESIFDGLGSGIGFIIALGLLSFIRELLGSFAIFGIPFTQKQAPISIFITSAGAFIVMGAIQAYLSYRKVRAKENGFAADAARLAKGKLITSKTNKPPVDATPKPAAPAAPTAPAQA
ncbi:MAG: Rnf-Nqr domain containing protein, partial [Candidatus Brocadiia bacterium]